MTQAQNAFDERYFELYVNPFLHQLRVLTAEQVTRGESVIEIGCGTGELCALLAAKCKKLTAIDSDEKFVAETRARLSDYETCKSNIIQGEFKELARFSDNEFDTALMMMTIHELTWEERQPVFQEALRIARRVVVADYLVPQPKDPHGSIARTAELLAGRKHFSNYQSFQKLGGLRALETSLKISPEIQVKNNIKTAEVVVYISK